MKKWWLSLSMSIILLTALPLSFNANSQDLSLDGNLQNKKEECVKSRQGPEGLIKLIIELIGPGGLIGLIAGVIALINVCKEQKHLKQQIGDREREINELKTQLDVRRWLELFSMQISAPDNTEKVDNMKKDQMMNFFEKSPLEQEKFVKELFESITTK